MLSHHNASHAFSQVDVSLNLNILVHLCLRIDARLQQLGGCCASQETWMVPVVHEIPALGEEPMKLGTARPHLSVTEKN